MIDYETLRIIWWVLMGAVLMGFAVTDGFDMGAGMLLHVVARNDADRRVVINTVGPVWEGNQVWFILGGGAIFAAWPSVYAVSFSGFYFGMLLVLMGLIIRPVSFKYRSKVEDTRWKAAWDFGLFLSGFVPALVFGVAIGNVLEGVPFYFDDSLRDFYTGSFWALLNPFAIVCGLTSVSMLVMHGGTYLCTKTTGDVQKRSAHAVRWAALVFVFLFAAAGFWVAHLSAPVITSVLATEGPSNPLYKQVSLEVGAWLNNYAQYPWMMIAPVLGFIGAIFTMILVSVKMPKLAWVFSALSIIGTIATVGFSQFPFILPSSTQPNMGLTVWDASSSQMTLMIMLVVAIIFLPIILAYTAWIYRVLRGKVTTDDVHNNTKNFY